MSIAERDFIDLYLIPSKEGASFDAPIFFKRKEKVMEKLKTKEFWEAAAARAIWTLCETFIAIAGAASLIEEINWHVLISSSLLAALLSLAKSIIKGLPEVDA